MIMILFGALSAGTKTYLLCRSDRHAFTSTFCNTLPVGCLKFCFSLEIHSSIWPFTIVVYSEHFFPHLPWLPFALCAKQLFLELTSNKVLPDMKLGRCLKNENCYFSYHFCAPPWNIPLHVFVDEKLLSRGKMINEKNSSRTICIVCSSPEEANLSKQGDLSFSHIIACSPIRFSHDNCGWRTFGNYHEAGHKNFKK